MICVVNMYIYMYGTFSFVALSRLRPFGHDNACCATQQALSAMSLSRHVCGATQLTSLLGDAADMSAVRNTGLVCCVTATDLSAV